MSEIRTIKKYPNRRLYDTAISSYITLADVKQLVMDNVEFQVVDAKSGEAITRNILLQIISEQEDEGSPIFSTDMLTKIIRFYGDNLQSVMSSYLEKSMEMFMEQQHILRDQMTDLMSRTPMAVMSEMADRNLALWQKMQENFFASATGKNDPSHNETPNDKVSGKKDR
ncbi:MAG: polyhydroxyalkanoate synthesis repressor PhaR [Proteobacteria bacterium]|nr:MAG: polyhydroxyalkanoate synthesis repressor PhaR [Pseudomonadota bacterium]